jgi:hypothetical protein
MRIQTALLLVATAACNSNPDHGSKEPASLGIDTMPMQGLKHFALLDLPNLEDNVRGDSLLVYTTHRIAANRFVMAARNKEETREGLRLYLYEPRPDSTADVLTVSARTVDSSSPSPVTACNFMMTWRGKWSACSPRPAWPTGMKVGT